jgi:FixJ family two-component response regulator
VELIGQGLTNRQIGERLLVSEKTVKNHVSMLFASLGMKRRTQVAADHMIRRLCRAHPLPAHSTADLPKQCSLVRGRRQL